MVVVMAPEATQEDVEAIVDLVRTAGGEAFVSRGVSRTIVGLVGDVEQFGALNLRSRSGVLDVVRISVPYKLISREHHPDRSVIRVGGVPIGPDTLTVIAGPCAVETHEQTLTAAKMAKAAGASLLRGGAFKPRTSPYAYQGLGEAGLKILAEVRAETGLPVVTEVIDPGSVDLVASYADMLQVGTRNMQNFALLQAVGSASKPVLLKRGMSATVEEWLMAAEYIAQRGNLNIVLCERADAPLAQHDVEVAALGDVLGGHQPLLDGGAHAPLEQHRLGRRADRLQEREVLHVPGADLEHVGVGGDKVHAARVDHLGHHGQPGLGPHLGEDLQPLLTKPLVGVGRGTRLESAAAQQ